MPTPPKGGFPNVPVTPTTPVVGMPPIPARRAPGSTPIHQKLLFARNQAVFRRVYHKTVRPGALVTFNYLFWKHDPYPLVLSTGVWADGKVAGVNLHYLTFGYIKTLISRFCGQTFAYENIKTNTFMKHSFRCYKKDGLRNIKLLDCEFLMWMMQQVRNYNPTEVQAIRQWVQHQLKQRLTQYNAKDLQTLSQEYEQNLPDTIKPELGGTRYAPHNLPKDWGNQNRPTFDQENNLPEFK